MMIWLYDEVCPDFLFVDVDGNRILTIVRLRREARAQNLLGMQNVLQRIAESSKSSAALTVD